MADEQKESKIKVEDLPQPEKELTAAEAKGVSGGVASPQGNMGARNMENILSSGSPDGGAQQVANVFGYVPASVPAPPDSAAVKQTK